MNRKKPKWRRFDHPWPGQWFAWGDVRACITRDDGLWHLSISCEYRYPTWDEIHAAWYDLVRGAEGEITGAILLPRKAEYVNLHPNCFHVYQLAEAEIPKTIISDTCLSCGALLQGGATQHEEGCKIKKLINDSFP